VRRRTTSTVEATQRKPLGVVVVVAGGGLAVELCSVSALPTGTNVSGDVEVDLQLGMSPSRRPFSVPRPRLLVRSG
jgi:hypothetical protein